jgi:hypothetical protein
LRISAVFAGRGRRRPDEAISGLFDNAGGAKLVRVYADCHPDGFFHGDIQSRQQKIMKRPIHL